MKAPRVTIVDYGLGNLFSIMRAVQFSGGRAEISSDPGQVENADRVILPGVGAFGEGMRRLRESGMDTALKRFISKGNPLLGICLGMQLLMTESQEFGRYQGLSILAGTVKRFKDPLKGAETFKIPHIGWNRVEYLDESLNEERNDSRRLFKGISSGAFFYFVHSFFCTPVDHEAVHSKTIYGHDIFCSVINLSSIWGCQFHPEKSGPEGIRLYHNFLYNL